MLSRVGPACSLTSRVVLALALAAGVAHAQGSAPAPPDAKTEDARKHFQNGVKLYGEQNYQGALAEFDAAYKLKPGPSSLKNIALCQKALFRYTDAVDTLDKVLARHDSELSADERKAVEEARTELASLVGSIVVHVTPAKARVLLDGRALSAAELGASIRLNTGEHTLGAEAPGYARVARTIRVAGGQKNVPVDFVLQASGGFVSVTTNDPNAAIAIDGKALAFFQWKGPLEPGRHYVQVYGEGFKNFEQPFVVELGQSVDLDVKLVRLPPGTPPAKPDEPTRQSGWYGLGVVSAVGLRNSPVNLEIDQSKVSGFSVGVRAGYRLWTPIGVELLLEGGRHTVTQACDKTVALQDPSYGCSTDKAVERSFTLDSLRLGPNLRIMSGGETIRFTSAAGVGAVRHQMKLDSIDASTAGASTSTQPGGEATGWDPYFLLELGVQYNWGHVLLELDGLAFIDGASNTKGRDDKGNTFAPFSDTGGLVMAGIGLRGGWSEWEPKK